MDGRKTKVKAWRTVRNQVSQSKQEREWPELGWWQWRHPSPFQPFVHISNSIFILAKWPMFVPFFAHGSLSVCKDKSI